jgi:PKD repeat protein
MYVVTLTVVDDAGLTGRRVELVSVGEAPDRPPVPVASAERTCFAGQLVGFSARSSYDPDGRVAAYLWDFGDGSGAEGASVSHRYGAAGFYNASLSVTDEAGLSSQMRISVSVLSPPVGNSEWAELTAEAGAAVRLPGGAGLVWLNSSGAVPILFFMYPGNPQPDSVLPPGQVGGFIDVSVGDTDAVEWPLYVEAVYDPASVPDGDEGRLGLYYHDGSGWTQCRDTGARPEEGVVWAWMRRDELRGSPLTVGLRSLIEGAAIRGLTLSSGDVGLGEEVTVSAEVLSLAEGEATFTLVLEVDGEAKALRTLTLGPGEARLVSFTLSLDEPGVYRVGVGGVTVPLTVQAQSLPDLTVSGVIASEATVGIPQTVSFSVSNVGGESSGAFNVSLLVGDTRAGVVDFGPLAPGGSVGAELAWTPDAAGAYRVRVVVDEWGGVREADEGNNEIVGDVGAAEPPVETSEWVVGGDTLALLPLGLGVVAVAGLWLLRRRRQSNAISL